MDGISKKIYLELQARPRTITGPIREGSRTD